MGGCPNFADGTSTTTYTVILFSISWEDSITADLTQFMAFKGLLIVGVSYNLVASYCRLDFADVVNFFGNVQLQPQMPFYGVLYFISKKSTAIHLPMTDTINVALPFGFDLWSSNPATSPIT